MDYGNVEDRREGLRLTPDQMKADAAMIAERFPELHTEVEWAPIGDKVGIIYNPETVKEAREVSGMLFPYWRKLLKEAPVMYDENEYARIGEQLYTCSSLLLVGSVPTKIWRDDLLPQELWGRWGIWKNRWMVMPVQDPRTLARGSAERWGEGVKKFFEGYVSGTGTWGLSGECVRGTCGNPLWKYDRDGVAWCEKHWTERYPSVTVKKAKAVRTGKIGERMIL